MSRQRNSFVTFHQTCVVGANLNRYLRYGIRFALICMFLGAVASFFYPAQVFTAAPQTVPEPIRVGVLHSLTGTMAISERSLVDAIQLAIYEINEDGGVLDRKIEAIVEDGASDWPTFAAKAEKLIKADRVSAIFGCWTSASRKAVLPVIEKNDHLLWYAVQYEGQESSRNVIYGGATPNQQIIPALNWLVTKLGKRRPFLIGSDYIFPRVANSIIKEYLNTKGIKPVGEVYHHLGDRNFIKTVEDIRRSGADLVLNTLNGDSNVGFFWEFSQAGLSADAVPVLSFSIAEDEIRSIGTRLIAGHYAAWNYFQSLDTETNRRFVQSFKEAYGLDRVTDDPIEAAYSQMYLFARAVARSGSSDPREIRAAAMGLELEAPGGLIRIDPSTQHTWKFVRLGRIRTDGQFDIIWSSNGPIKPEPFGLIGNPLDSNVQGFSEFKTGNAGPMEIEALQKALADQDILIRRHAAQRIAEIGESFMPILERWLLNADHTVRSSAVYALGLMGSKAKKSIPSIIPLLRDSNVLVREYALRALIRIGTISENFLSSLVDVISDSDPIVRRLAITALCQLAPRIPESLQELTRAIACASSSGRTKITDVVVEIATNADDRFDTKAIVPLRNTIRTIEGNVSDEDLRKVQRALNHLQDRTAGTLGERVVAELKKNYLLDVVLLYILLFPLVGFVGLRICPLLIFRANLAIQPYTDARLPDRLGGWRVPFVRSL